MQLRGREVGGGFEILFRIFDSLNFFGGLTMKKFGIFLLLLSLGTFNFGCNKPAEGPTAPAAEDGGDAPAEGAATEEAAGEGE